MRARRWARAALRRADRWLAPAPAPEVAATEEGFRAQSLWSAGTKEVERWNREWLHYLGREWQQQLVHHTVYPETPPLPVRARDMLRHDLGRRPALELYADPEWVKDRKVMELGCGCGNLGKLVGRYAEHYLGVDFSPLALQVAKLVSPEACTYIQVADRDALVPFFETRDAVLARYFFIHQNAEMAGHVLDYAASFLKRGGRLFADFYTPNPDKAQGVVLRPGDVLSARHASATFHYERSDVEALLEGRPYRWLREEVVLEVQRRFVVLERT